MDQRSMKTTLAAAPKPSFTCEVCHISVRSAQKLIDHVNFSPLHKAALGGDPTNGYNRPSSATGAGQRSVIYDGNKLFWRINETLEVCIDENIGANCVTISAFHEDEAEKTEQATVMRTMPETNLTIPPVQLDLRKLKGALGLHESKMLQNQEQAIEVEVKYLLARLIADRSADGTISLHLQKLHANEVDPASLLYDEYSQCSRFMSFPNNKSLALKLNSRRRHSVEDVKIAQKEMNHATARLKEAREQAEHLSNLVRMSIENLALMKTAEGDTRQQSMWLRAFEKVRHIHAVERSRIRLAAMAKDHKAKNTIELQEVVHGAA